MGTLYDQTLHDGRGGLIDEPSPGYEACVPRRRFPIPSFEAGKLIVTWPDGRIEELDRLTATTQADLWWAAIRAAALNAPQQHQDKNDDQDRA